MDLTLRSGHEMSQPLLWNAATSSQPKNNNNDYKLKTYAATSFISL